MKNTITAKEYVNQFTNFIYNAHAKKCSTGKNFTTLNIVKAMQGKMMSVTIGTDENGKLSFYRTTGKKTRITDYTEKDVLNVMMLTGKSVGEKVTMWSLSTSSKKNARCQEHRKVSGSICKYCFSETAQDKDPGMQRNLEYNYDVLTKGFLNWDDIPVIDSDFFRFESHGDLDNDMQLINYLMFCEKALTYGSKTRFAIWTKNPEIMHFVFDVLGIRKPENLQIQVSSLYLDTVAPKQYSWIDRVFTVWTDVEIAKSSGAKLNCCDGIRKHTYCIACNNCYVSGNGIENVNELLRVKV